jgi:glycosyltransferase involved in cell wall biosynthesis
MEIKIAIDASRCRSGGAFAHIYGIIAELDPTKFGISEIHLWSHKKLLDYLPNYPWLIKHNSSYLQKNILLQIFWQAFILKKEVIKFKCNILFTLDASTFCRFKNQVVLSQDMLSYEPGVMKLFGFSKARLRILLILWVQNTAFKRAKGVIFLTNYAAKVIQGYCGTLTNLTIIPHGVGSDFKIINKDVTLSLTNPIKCLYVSNTAFYKYQWHVVKAIELLRQSGFKIELELIGGGNGKAQKLLEAQVHLSDPQNLYIKQVDFVPQFELPQYISNSDIFIFASGCENMPVTLLEGMAAGMPIACSNRGPMPEVLESAGIYFNPEDPNDIAEAIRKLIINLDLRLQLSKNAKSLADKYSWTRCSNETFSFLTETLKKTNQ